MKFAAKALITLALVCSKFKGGDPFTLSPFRRSFPPQRGPLSTTCFQQSTRPEGKISFKDIHDALVDLNEVVEERNESFKKLSTPLDGISTSLDGISKSLDGRSTSLDGISTSTRAMIKDLGWIKHSLKHKEDKPCGIVRFFRKNGKFVGELEKRI